MGFQYKRGRDPLPGNIAQNIQNMGVSFVPGVPVGCKILILLELGCKIFILNGLAWGCLTCRETEGVFWCGWFVKFWWTKMVCGCRLERVGKVSACRQPWGFFDCGSRKRARTFAQNDGILDRWGARKAGSLRQIPLSLFASSMPTMTGLAAIPRPVVDHVERPSEN